MTGLEPLATTEVRTVVQYHFQDWPDFGVPATPDKFLNFLRVVNRDHPSLPGRPNVVHCSAGIGRSGTFCLVDSALEKFGSTDTLSQQSILNQEEVLQMLVRMRTQRDGQVPQLAPLGTKKKIVHDFAISGGVGDF